MDDDDDDDDDVSQAIDTACTKELANSDVVVSITIALASDKAECITCMIIKLHKIQLLVMYHAMFIETICRSLTAQISFKTRTWQPSEQYSTQQATDATRRSAKTLYLLHICDNDKVKF